MQTEGCELAEQRVLPSANCINIKMEDEAAKLGLTGTEHCFKAEGTDCVPVSCTIPVKVECEMEIRHKPELLSGISIKTESDTWDHIKLEHGDALPDPDVKLNGECGKAHIKDENSPLLCDTDVIDVKICEETASEERHHVLQQAVGGAVIPTKRKRDASSGYTVKKRKTITMENKVEIIRRSETGETPSSIARAFGYSRSTIATILKDKCRIMEHVKDHFPMNSTIISKHRSGLIIEMERLLIIWIEDQNQRNMPISLSLVQKKARSLFNGLKAARTASGGDGNKEFVASRGWFYRFKERANLHNIKVQGEAAMVDVCSASDFPKALEDIIDEGGYLPDQIFNVDETGLIWKKMPEKPYILKEAKSDKASKDRLSLFLGGNASGDLKLKPLVVHHSPNPRALHNVAKASLPVIWRANTKAWVTDAVCQDWFLNHFVPAVEGYCLDKNIPFKILLVLGIAPRHSNTLVDIHPNVKVVFLPPNTTSLLQPKGQGVIASFKAHYLHRTFSQAITATQNDVMTLREFWKTYSIYNAIKNIADAWDEVEESNMRKVWSKMCPQFTQKFLGFTDDIADTRQAVVAIGNELQLDISENYIIDFLDSNGKQLLSDDLVELEQQMNWHLEAQELKKFNTKELADAFRLIESGMAKLEEQDPDTERFKKVYHIVTESLRCYRAIYDEKKLCACPPSCLLEETPAAE